MELAGKVILVPDGDGFRFYHHPLFCCSAVNIPKGEMESETIKIRIAGIDAPEVGHDGNASQPFAIEARDYLRKQVEGKTVYIRIHGSDQFNRIIATVQTKSFIFFRRNIGLDLVERGLATIYRAKGAQYGNYRNELEDAEKKAKSKKRGIWSIDSKAYVSPAEYKRQLKK